MTDFVTDEYRMFSGQGAVMERKFKKYQGKSGNTWYLSLQDNCADNVYVDQHNPKSDGFGGATLTFELEDGTIDSVKGPWHSNSKAFSKDTGIDITNKHLTFVVISKERGQDEKYRTVMKDVLYEDEHPILGVYDRYKDIAKPFIEEAVKNETNLYYYSKGTGGSSNGPIVWKGKHRA